MIKDNLERLIECTDKTEVFLYFTLIYLIVYSCFHLYRR